MFIVAEVPNDIMEMIGKARYVPVRGILNGVSFKSTCVTRSGGRYVLILNSEIRKKARKNVGDTVELHLAYDPENRDIPLPEDVELILAEDQEILEEFLNASPSNRREYIKYILQARHEETRLKRINLLVQRMRERILKRKNKI